MNKKIVINVIGRIIVTEAVLLLLPVAIAIYFGEMVPLKAFLITVAIAAFLGFIFLISTRKSNSSVFASEGFSIVAFAWILMSLIGCLPFVISGEIPNFFDAFFETVSGFTTTGATILADVESMSKSILFWRSFTHWIGGMGVLVFVLAVIPGSQTGGMHMIRAEMPGPLIGKLVPKLRDTAKILYCIYIGLTVLEIILLVIGDMPLYESVVHSLGTAGTGGFGVKNDSIGGYSPYLQWVITIFMLLFGVNFNIYYLILIRKIRSVFHSIELWVYILIVLVSVSVITFNVFSLYNNVSDSLRYSAFQVASIISTTGYSTTDFNLWPDLSKGILLLLMMVGGCAGSTAGGLKVSRVVLLFKMISREIKRLLHPRAVSKVRFEGRNVEEATLDSVNTYFAIYVTCFIAVFLLLSLEPVGFETNFTATMACFNNVGPGLAGVGPISNYAAYSSFSKCVLSLAMLLGRLEIFPLIIAFSASSLSRKRR